MCASGPQFIRARLCLLHSFKSRWRTSLSSLHCISIYCRACSFFVSKEGASPGAGFFLTCGLAPSNMCSLVYKIYIIVQNIALDRVVCVCTSVQPHTAPAIAISPHARTTGLNLTRGSYHSDQYGSCTSSCFSTH